MNKRKPHVGAIIRTSVSEQMATNASLLASRVSHIMKLTNILSTVEDIDTFVIAVPDTPGDRNVRGSFAIPETQWYFGNVHDRAQRMIECAEREGINVIVDLSDQYHLDLGEAEKISSLIRYHLFHDADYTEPVGFLVNTLPRIVNHSALKKNHELAPDWPYYEHIHKVEGLRIEYFFAPDGDLDTTTRMLWETTSEFKKEILLQAFEKLPGQSGGFLQTAMCFQELRRDFERFGLTDCAGRHILEIGPNAHLGYGLVFALLGAERVYLVEKCRQARINARKIAELLAFYRAVAPQIFPHLGIRDFESAMSSVFPTTGCGSRLNESRVTYLCPMDLVDAPIPDGSVDFCLSVSSLEHDDHPLETIKAIYRMLKPGGVTFHTIDFSDHVSPNRPLDFLKYSDREWKVAKQYQPSGRYRYPDFVKMFREAGFIVKEVVPKRELLDRNALKETIHPEILAKYNLEELSVCEIKLWATKQKMPSM